MTEKELLSQLKNLKEIKPDENWKNQSRDVLLSQISSHEIPAVGARSYVLAQFMDFFSRPAAVVAAVLLLIFGGGAASISASKNTKPGDSLYIAKKISEKAKLAITFSPEKKAKLSIEFAGNRAKEMAQLTAEENGAEEKEKKVGRLAEDFKKEIASAKTTLKKINVIGEKKESENNDSEKIAEGEEMFSANLGRTDKGMQIYVQDKNGSRDESLAGIAATSSAAQNVSAPDKSSSLEKALGEAEELLDKRDYDGTIDKLSEANNLIDGMESKGEVKGVSESASTTEK